MIDSTPSDLRRWSGEELFAWVTKGPRSGAVVVGSTTVQDEGGGGAGGRLEAVPRRVEGPKGSASKTNDSGALRADVGGPGIEFAAGAGGVARACAMLCRCDLRTCTVEFFRLSKPGRASQ